MTPWSWNSCRVVIRKRAVADLLGEHGAGQVLRGGGQLAARHADPDHELIRLVLPLFLQEGADVAVVLLVRAVELQDGRGVLADVVAAVDHLLGEDRLEVLAGDLDRLDLARGLGFPPLRRSPSPDCRCRCRSRPSHWLSPDPSPARFVPAARNDRFPHKVGEV